MKLTGENRSTRRKPCPSATLSTTNPTWTDPGSSTGLRGESPATNCLSHGTANFRIIMNSVKITVLTVYLKNRNGCHQDYYSKLIS
jgi:hypothetical protein